MLRSLVILAVVAAAALPANAERVKDVTDIVGYRGNPLTGFGIVVGLNGTGDDSIAARRALANWLRKNRQIRLVLDPQDLTSKNIAFVAVEAMLPPDGRLGTRIDVTVSSVGEASSLQGGRLLATQLAGMDGEVYALATGSLVVGGFSSSGKSASIVKNIPTVGRISNGATIEREELADFVLKKGKERCVAFQLKNPDFATAKGIAEAINKKRSGIAKATDARTVEVTVPPKVTRRSEVIDLVVEINALTVEVDTPAVVIVNERTGVIIVGENVKVSAGAILLGSMTVVTEEKDYASQPLPFSRAGETKVLNRTQQSQQETKRPFHVMPKQVSLSELARGLNALGLTPRELIAVFQELKAAGKLQAELRVR